ncbi:MAG: type II toxin-antitoxin system VapC family toxin [Alphaproteobacteria bacterium]|nr:type II toxin-antitoxin system VapC family toxin [Alphaproteobacteria bacterium]
MKCLDTNAVIAVLNNRPASARGRLAQELASGERVGISTVALFELIYGCEKSAQRARNEAALRSLLTLDVEPLPFELADAEHAGAIRAQLERSGTPIGHYDLLIAAQARRHGATLVTANQREFARVPGLDVMDWVTA